MRQEIAKLVSGSSFIFGSRVAGAIIVFLTHIYLARWMGAEQLGFYVYAFALVVLLSTIAGVGFPAASLRVIGQGLADNDLARIRGFIKYGLQVTLIASLVVGGSVVILALLMRQQIPTGYFMPVVLAMLGVPFFALLRFNLRVAHAMSWFKMAFLPNMLIRPVIFIILLYIVWQASAHLSANTAILVQVIVLILVTLVHFIIIRKMLSWKISGEGLSYDKKEWHGIAAPLLLVTLFTQYFPEISIIAIGVMLPPEDIAIFNACYKVALLIGFGLAAVNSYTIPKISRQFASGDKDNMQRLVAVATQMKFWPSLLALLVFALFGHDILGLFGDEFTNGYVALLILGAAQLVMAAIGPVDVLLSITGHQNLCMRVFAFSIVATFLLILVLVPIYGVNGAAMTVLVVVLLWSTWLHILVVRHLDVRPSVLSFRTAYRNAD